MPDIIKPRPRSLAIVRRVIGRDVTVRDVAIGVVRRRWWWVVLYVAVLLVPTVFAEVAMIPIIGVLAVPLSLVVFFGGNYLLTYLFPDAHGVRALGVTADSLVVVRYGGVFRKASLVRVVPFSSVTTTDARAGGLWLTLGDERVGVRRREIPRLAGLSRSVGYGYTQV